MLFEISLHTYRILSVHQPTYFINVLHLSYILRTLRSTISKQLFVPKTKLNIGKRAFPVAAPPIWNQLLITIKSETTATFRKKGKTYLFEILFPP